jgi:hypothetical protein
VKYSIRRDFYYEKEEGFIRSDCMPLKRDMGRGLNDNIPQG